MPARYRTYPADGLTAEECFADLAATVGKVSPAGGSEPVGPARPGWACGDGRGRLGRRS